MNDPAGEQPNLVARLAWTVVVIGAAMIIIGSLGIIHNSNHTSTSTVPVVDSVVSVTTAPLPIVHGPFAAGRHPLRGFGEVAVRVRQADGRSKILCMMVARTLPQQERGLMEVTDHTLGGYEGMLFVFPADTTGGFWIRDTPMPLSIAYLTAAGTLVSRADMAPCADVPTCPGYSTGGPYRMAVEVPQGRLDQLGLGPDAKLEQAGRCAPVG